MNKGTPRCAWAGGARAGRARGGAKGEPRTSLVVRRHAAASYGHVDILEYLLSQECNVNVEDADGDTPLHFCESQECAELLLVSGAELEHKNAEDQVPIQVAAEDGRVDMVAFFREVYAVRGLEVPELPEHEPDEDDEDDEDFDGDDGEDGEDGEEFEDDEHGDFA
jgi:Ankyrin repeats (3 copies)